MMRHNGTGDTQAVLPASHPELRVRHLDKGSFSTLVPTCESAEPLDAR
jgi:hypothetical protein